MKQLGAASRIVATCVGAKYVGIDFYCSSGISAYCGKGKVNMGNKS